MEPITIVAGLILGGWLLCREKKEDRLVRLAREAAEAETQQLRDKIHAQQDADKKSQREAEAATRKAIQEIRDRFYSSIFKPLGARRKVDGSYYVGDAYYYQSKGSMNAGLGAWRAYMIMSNGGLKNVPYEWKPYARMLIAKYRFFKVERFGNPRTVEEARITAERIKLAMDTAVIKEIAKHYQRQIAKLKERV